MGNKAECPGCNAYLSSVWLAFQNHEPCPECGLSAEAAAEVLAVRRTRADEGLKARLEEALVRAGKAEAEARRLGSRLERVRSALDEDWPDPF